MHTLIVAVCALLLGTVVAAQSLPSTGIPAPILPLGSASNNGILRFEDVEKLSPPMSEAVQLLRTHEYKAAEAAFQKVYQAKPEEGLAYKGEIEAGLRLNTLGSTVMQYRKNLELERQANKPGHNEKRQLAVLYWALGEAVMMEKGYYPKFIGDNPTELGEEPRKQFLEALQLDPELLVAHLSLAAYYEHQSVEKGSLARLQYRESFRLRPDLFQIRYLHAYTWDRPGIILNEAVLNARGFTVSEDRKRMPEKAIAEYLALVRDHPNYAPPYYCLGDDYYLQRDEAKAIFYWKKYLEVGNKEGEAWKRVKSTVDAMNERPS
jgi:tetratricopeptide (TPR) repeat protein